MNHSRIALLGGATDRFKRTRILVLRHEAMKKKFDSHTFGSISVSGCTIGSARLVRISCGGSFASSADDADGVERIGKLHGTSFAVGACADGPANGGVHDASGMRGRCDEWKKGRYKESTCYARREDATTPAYARRYTERQRRASNVPRCVRPAG